MRPTTANNSAAPRNVGPSKGGTRRPDRILRGEHAARREAEGQADAGPVPTRVIPCRASLRQRSRFGTEREPNPDLTRAARDGIRRHAVDAHRRQQQADQAHHYRPRLLQHGTVSPPGPAQGFRVFVRTARADRDLMRSPPRGCRSSTLGRSLVAARIVNVG